MCLFITGVLPRASRTPSFRALAAAAGLAFDPLDNQRLLEQLEPTERCYRVTNGMCDCSTALGTLSAPRSRDRAVARMRKDGWSETKINRWLISTQHQPRAKPPPGELTTEAWAGFLRAALDLPEVAYVGLMMHWYQRSPHDEDFVVEDRQSASIRDRVGPHVPWRENVIYELRP